MTSIPEVGVTADPLEIVRLRDRHGVLSVYVDADPREQSASKPAWVVAVENGLDEIRERVKAEGDRARWAAFRERLDELEPELAGLLDPRASGRGRALFTTVEGGESRRVSVQMPLVTRVVLDDVADLTPLMVALDRGRPAGLVVVSLAAAQVLEQRLGVVEELVSIPLEPDTSDWRELKGPAAANPALAQHGAPQRDLFERRLDEHRTRLLEDAVPRLVRMADQRSWDRVVVAGETRLAQSVASAFERDSRDVAVVDRRLNAQSSAAVGEVLAPALEAANARREARLVERALGAALSGRAGALGLPDVLAAFGDGRVKQLLFDAGREYRGARAPDGRLLPEGVVPPGVSAEELEPEASLTGHMIERALASDAGVTPLSPTGVSALAAHDGIAALLRW